MVKSAINYESSTQLISAVTWVRDTDKALPAGDARRYVKFEQESGESCGLTGYCVGGAWLFRRVLAQGLVGLVYLIDGEDLAKRLGEGFDSTFIRISPYKNETKVNVEAVISAEESAGNIVINCYSGELEDFVEDYPTEWHHVGNLDGWKYREATNYCTSFSQLRSAVPTIPAWLNFTTGSLSITSCEPGGTRGDQMIAVDLPASTEQELAFGIPGRFLYKTSDLFNEENVWISVAVDDLDDPKFVKFEGLHGWAIIPILDEYECQALSRGAQLFFYSDKIETLSSRDFSLPTLSQGVKLQMTPANGRNDRILRVVDGNMVITKRGDIYCKEKSIVPTFSINGEGEWIPVVVSQDALERITTTMSTFDKNAEKRAAFSERYQYEEDEDYEPAF